MGNHYQVIKIIAAVLLLLAFFLPMSSCSYNVTIDSDGAETRTEKRVVINYAREYVDLGEVGAWLNILAFTWPFPLLFLQWRYRGRKYSVLLTWTGLFLSLMSAVAVYTWADIGTPLIGAYVGGGATLLLFGSYAAELMGYIRWRPGGKWKNTERDRG
jgi:hypothetical protein